MHHIHNHEGALAETQACNREFFRLLAGYLNACPTLVTRELIEELTDSCAVSEKEAFCAILSAAFGWEEEENEHDRRLFHEYLLPSVRALEPTSYLSDPYYQNVRIPDRRLGKWRLQEAHYAPYEGFVCGSLALTEQLAEIPPIGYFADGFSYPMVLENGVEWMAIKPNEIETMRAPIAGAHGRVLTYGLGLGYFAYMAARRPEVSSVTVIERDKDVITLFREEILPQLEVFEKIHVIEADAFAFADSPAARGFDYVFCDLWHDASDGLPLYIRMRKIEKTYKDPPYVYWVEDMILSRLRAMVYDGICNGTPSLTDEKEIYKILQDPYLRQLAPDLRAVQEG
ncbi:MAG: hypothetical protein IJY20_08085 [Clostridia bacterium]|nr:hypothetical protein [Clostridia bacterium]